MVKYLAFRLAALVVPALPRGLAYRLARWAATTAFLFPSNARKTLEDNLRRVLGEDASARDLRQAARGAFETQALNYVDLFRIPYLSPKFFQEQVKVGGEQYFSMAKERGRGVILASAHLGNVDLLMQMAVTTGIDSLVIIEPIKPPKLLELVTGLRSSRGVTFLIAGMGAVRAAVRALKSGGIVAIACDRDIQGHGVPVPFFGEIARLPSGAVELAMKTGAALLPVFGARWPDGTYTITIDPPLELLVDRERALEENLKLLAGTLEKHIRRHPEQWLAFHRIWVDAPLPKPLEPEVALNKVGKR